MNEEIVLNNRATGEVIALLLKLSKSERGTLARHFAALVEMANRLDCEIVLRRKS